MKRSRKTRTRHRSRVTGHVALWALLFPIFLPAQSLAPRLDSIFARYQGDAPGCVLGIDAGWHRAGASRLGAGDHRAARAEPRRDHLRGRVGLEAGDCGVDSPARRARAAAPSPTTSAGTSRSSRPTAPRSPSPTCCSTPAGCATGARSRSSRGGRVARGPSITAMCSPSWRDSTGSIIRWTPSIRTPTAAIPCWQCWWSASAGRHSPSSRRVSSSVRWG